MQATSVSTLSEWWKEVDGLVCGDRNQHSSNAVLWSLAAIGEVVYVFVKHLCCDRQCRQIHLHSAKKSNNKERVTNLNVKQYQGKKCRLKRVNHFFFIHSSVECSSIHHNLFSNLKASNKQCNHLQYNNQSKNLRCLLYSSLPVRIVVDIIIGATKAVENGFICGDCAIIIAAAIIKRSMLWWISFVTLRSSKLRRTRPMVVIFFFISWVWRPSVRCCALHTWSAARAWSPDTWVILNKLVCSFIIWLKKYPQ